MSGQKKVVQIGLVSGKTISITSEGIEKESLAVQCAELIRELRSQRHRRDCFLFYGKVLVAVRLDEVSFVTADFELSERSVSPRKIPGSGRKKTAKKAVSQG